MNDQHKGEIAPEAATVQVPENKTTQVRSVMENSVTQAEKLRDYLVENRKVVGSDIALKELGAAVHYSEQIVASLSRAILADR